MKREQATSLKKMDREKLLWMLRSLLIEKQSMQEQIGKLQEENQSLRESNVELRNEKARLQFEAACTQKGPEGNDDPQVIKIIPVPPPGRRHRRQDRTVAPEEQMSVDTTELLQGMEQIKGSVDACAALLQQMCQSRRSNE
ncbi:MAG: hypothetical protein PUC61_05440 [Bacteroidales bacterium]|nr:hypothetical protein [Bacteroidales bacterium]